MRNMLSRRQLLKSSRIIEMDLDFGLTMPNPTTSEPSIT